MRVLLKSDTSDMKGKMGKIRVRKLRRRRRKEGYIILRMFEKAIRNHIILCLPRITFNVYVTICLCI